MVHLDSDIVINSEQQCSVQRHGYNFVSQVYAARIGTRHRDADCCQVVCTPESQWGLVDWFGLIITNQ